MPCIFAINMNHSILAATVALVKRDACIRKSLNHRQQGKRLSLRVPIGSIFSMCWLPLLARVPIAFKCRRRTLLH